MRLVSAKRSSFSVLGAGVSHSYGLPSWPALLQELLMHSNNVGRQDTAELADIYTQIVRPNPLIAARYSRLKLKDKFVGTVRDILYKRIKTDETSLLIREIRRLVIAAGKAPNLDSIITFNFDDVLERALEIVDVDVPFQVISDVEIKAKPGSLPIYHVHGYLPRNGQIPASAKLILSEDDYHARYSDIYNWSNLVQINKYRENTCLFIGTSFSDPNLRRLLDIAQKQRGDDEHQHFLLRKRYAADEVLSSLLAAKITLEDAEHQQPAPDEAAAGKRHKLADQLVSLMETIDEQDAASFGVATLWVKSFDEIPTILRNLTPSAVQRRVAKRGGDGRR